MAQNEELSLFNSSEVSPPKAPRKPRKSKPLNAAKLPGEKSAGPKKTGAKSSGENSAGSEAEPSKKILRGEIVRPGKDEMNLIEHPFAVLSQKESRGSVIDLHWDATHPVTGKIVPATWMVTGNSTYGLPNTTDERVYLVLLELTRENGFSSPIVHFSRYDLLRRLGWRDDGRAYKTLQGAFDRLKGVTIYSRNAFFNPRSRSFTNTNFGILEYSSIDNERAGRKTDRQTELTASSFKWNDVLFQSFQAGFIRTIDLDFALSLEGDIALRLYRYLDKKAFNGRARFDIELSKLCINHLGLKATPYASKFKERLKGAHDELLDKGFLDSVAYEEMKSRKGVKVCYRFGPKASKGEFHGELISSSETREEFDSPASQMIEGLLELPFSTLPVEDEAEDAALSEPQVWQSRFARRVEEAAPALPEQTVARQEPELIEEPDEAELLNDEARELLVRMEAIHVSRPIALELLGQWPASAIRCQLDCLDDRKPRSRAATFVKSVRELWALPEEHVKRIEAQEAAQKRQMACDHQEAEKARQIAAQREETTRLEEESVRLDLMWGNLDETTRSRIDADINGKLGILGAMGRGEAAKTAFRRTALRELLDQATAPTKP